MNVKAFPALAEINIRCIEILVVNFTIEDRIRGDIKYIEGNGDATHQYFEDNESHRFSTQLSFTRKLSEDSTVNLKIASIILSMLL